MSLILDALNRADEKRSEGTNDINLRSSQSPVPTDRNPLRRWVIEGIIICLAISALVYSVFSKQPLPAQTGSIPTSTLNIEAITSPTIEVPKASPSQNTNSQAQNLNLKNIAITTTASRLTKAVALTTTNPSIASLYQQAPEKAPPITAVKPKPIKTEDISQQILQKIPLLTELSLRFQRSIPNIDYSVHMYSQQGSGFVTINGHIKKTGAIIAPNLRVIEILENSLVLDYQGRQFRLPALNSWVNYQ